MSAQQHQLAPWLQQLVDNWVVSPQEASQIEDVWLMTPPDEEQTLPPHLQPAGWRIGLFNWPSSPTLH